MKLSKKDIIKYLIVLVLILSVFLPIKLIRESLAETTSFTLSAVLYDTNMYAGGSGTELSTSGATVNSWQHGTSKYLQINPRITANGKKHFLKVILPKELYAVSSELVTPAGFSDLKFTKNSALPVNDRTVSYGLKTYSGTFEYTMDVGFETGNIQMELQWDDNLWDKRANVSITPSGVKPISVVLYEEEDNGGLTQLRELSISRVTTGSGISGFGVRTYIYNGFGKL